MVINIAFNISDPLKSKIIELSECIRDRHGSDWWVDDDRYHLHLPLYLFECPEHNLDRLVEESKNFAGSLRRIEVVVDSLFHNGKGLIMVDFSTPKQLYNYHVKALGVYNPIREGMLREKYRDTEYLKSLPEEDRHKIEKYGHLWVLDKYNPHVTISRLKDLGLADRLADENRADLVGQKAFITRLQVHEAIFGPKGYTKILVDEEIR